MFDKIENNPKKSLFIFGLFFSLSFAPTFFFPLLFLIAFLAYLIKNAESAKVAAAYGFWFGFGFCISSLYWISIGVSVYINDFWWAIPFAFFGLPLFLSIFITFQSTISWYFRNSQYYILFFSIFWVIFELLRSFLFTGFPWNLLGYSLAFSDYLLQPFSIFGTYGMSFIVVFLSAHAISLIEQKYVARYILFLALSLSIIFVFGYIRLKNHPTKFYDIKLRLVQANIPQSDKWDNDLFWSNLESHVELSRVNPEVHPNIILWSEAAVVAPYTIPQVRRLIESAIIYPDSFLITGGITYVNKKLFSSLYSIDQRGDILFEYHKSHLIPFGEYTPLKHIIPFIKKLTPGTIDYSPGTMGQIVYLPQFSLKIRPLICYEVIFPRESITKDADVIVNLTNDTWYGNSTGPYQHFQMARMRAVENGIPLVRVANSGISAIIDPLGRIISKSKLSHTIVLDNYLPQKLKQKTYYVKFQEFTSLVLLLYFALMSYFLNPKKSSY